MFLTLGALVLLGAGALAALILGHHIFASSFADNPQNALDDQNNHFATLRFSDNNISCPPGFDKNGSVCNHNGTKIRGWLAVDFTAGSGGLPDITAIQTRFGASPCFGSSCDYNASLEVFTAPDLNANPIAWTHLGKCTANQPMLCIKYTNPYPSTVESVLIGRSDYARGTDPLVDWVKIDYNASP